MIQHPDRIVTPDPHISTRSILPPMGWLAVYALAALLFGALAYYATRTS